MFALIFYDRKQALSWPDRISNKSLDHGAGGRQLLQVSAACSLGNQSSPTPNTLLLATGRPEWYIWSSLTSVCLLPVRDTWHFQTTVELEQSYFVWKDCRWAERCYTWEERSSDSLFALAEVGESRSALEAPLLAQNLVKPHPMEQGKSHSVC